MAYNYLGMVLQSIDQLEPAMDAYRKATQLNPRLYAAQENLVNASKNWEAEQYHLFSNLNPLEPPPDSIDLDESQISEMMVNVNPVPGWLYLDEKAFLLTGWVGNRNRITIIYSPYLIVGITLLVNVC